MKRRIRRRITHQWTRWILPAAVAIAVSVVPASAHHSIAGAYDSRQKITLEGVVAQFQFVNPHPFLTVDVKSGGGTLQWVLEMDNRSELIQAGMTSQTLKPGDQIVVTGNPARDKSHRVYTARLDRPADGFWYEQVGNSPRIRPTR